MKAWTVCGLVCISGLAALAGCQSAPQQGNASAGFSGGSGHAAIYVLGRSQDWASSDAALTSQDCRVLKSAFAGAACTAGSRVSGVPGGHLSAWFRYEPLKHGRVKVLAVKASFTSGKGYALPVFVFAFSSGPVDAAFHSRPFEANNAKRGATGWIAPASGKRLIFPANELADASLWAENPQTGLSYPVAQLGVFLTPNGR